MVLSAVIFFLGNINIVQANIKEGKVYKNISIEDIDVSDLTKYEAEIKVEKFINNHSKIKFLSNDKIYNLDIKDVGVVYKIKESVEESYNIGRNKNIISNISAKINLKYREPITVEIEKTYDEDKLNKYINSIQEDIKKEPINATIKLENYDLIYEKEQRGVKLDTNEFKNIIINKIKNIDCYNEAKVPTIDIKPKYIYDDLSKINTVLGTYETYFNPKKYNRVNNIKVGVNATNNIVLNPSEEFSFNSYVEVKEVQDKFKNAPVIINGELKEGLGGGICQVSSTLYNAALYAGLEITNVKNHSIPSPYVSKGRDATISTGGIDLKFKNSFRKPIFINQQVYEDRIVSTIYGDEEYKKDIEIVTELVKSVPHEVKVKSSDKLYEGEKNISQKGRNGYKVNTFRIYKGNGEVIKELIRENYYPPIDKIIIYGTKIKESNNFNMNIT
jgi:vancomycin resistance protein YoaR